jgi:hypothetical protein
MAACISGATTGKESCGAIGHEDDARAVRAVAAGRLAEVGRRVLDVAPFARFADDQPFRLTSLAFERPERIADEQALVAALVASGANATVNNLRVLGWLGGYDQLAMSRRIMAEVYAVDIEASRDEILYSGDSINDAPMFGFFRHTVGVSTVRHNLAEILPRRAGSRGDRDGFVEIAEAVIAAKTAG